MLSAKMTDVLNRQVNREIYSAYLYLGMAAGAGTAGFPGAANWFRVQVKEELIHAEKFIDYVGRRGNRVILEAIESPPQEFSSLADLFRRTLAHEKKVSAMIRGLAATAKKEKDPETGKFLLWFLDEQKEEEENASRILRELKRAQGRPGGLAALDRRLGGRIFTPEP